MVEEFAPNDARHQPRSGIAKFLARTEIVPRFRGGDFPGGIAAGADAVMAAAKGEYKGSGRTADQGRRRSHPSADIATIQRGNGAAGTPRLLAPSISTSRCRGAPTRPVDLDAPGGPLVEAGGCRVSGGGSGG